MKKYTYISLFLISAGSVLANEGTIPEFYKNIYPDNLSGLKLGLIYNIAPNYSRLYYNTGIIGGLELALYKNITNLSFELGAGITNSLDPLFKQTLFLQGNVSFNYRIYGPSGVNASLGFRANSNYVRGFGTLGYSYQFNNSLRYSIGLFSEFNISNEQTLIIDQINQKDLHDLRKVVNQDTLMDHIVSQALQDKYQIQKFLAPYKTAEYSNELQQITNKARWIMKSPSPSELMKYKTPYIWGKDDSPKNMVDILNITMRSPLNPITIFDDFYNSQVDEKKYISSRYTAKDLIRDEQAEMNKTKYRASKYRLIEQIKNIQQNIQQNMDSQWTMSHKNDVFAIQLIHYPRIVVQDILNELFKDFDTYKESIRAWNKYQILYQNNNLQKGTDDYEKLGYQIEKFASYFSFIIDNPSYKTTSNMDNISDVSLVLSTLQKRILKEEAILEEFQDLLPGYIYGSYYIGDLAMQEAKIYEYQESLIARLPILKSIAKALAEIPGEKPIEDTIINLKSLNIPNVILKQAPIIGMFLKVEYKIIISNNYEPEYYTIMSVL